jgi:hypothetical protein
MVEQFVLDGTSEKPKGRDWWGDLDEPNEWTEWTRVSLRHNQMAQLRRGGFFQKVRMLLLSVMFIWIYQTCLAFFSYNKLANNIFQPSFSVKPTALMETLAFGVVNMIAHDGRRHIHKIWETRPYLFFGNN